VDEQLATASAGTSMVVRVVLFHARGEKPQHSLLQIRERAGATGTPGRIRHGGGGNNRAAVAAVLQLIDTLGLTPLMPGASSRACPAAGGPVFGEGHSAKELSNLISRDLFQLANSKVGVARQCRLPRQIPTFKRASAGSGGNRR